MNNTSNDVLSPSTPYFQAGYPTPSPNSTQVLRGAEFTLKPTTLQPQMNMSPITLAQAKINMSPISLGVGNTMANPSFLLNPEDPNINSPYSPMKKISKKTIQPPTSISFCSNASGSEQNEIENTHLEQLPSLRIGGYGANILGMTPGNKVGVTISNIIEKSSNISKIQESSDSERARSSVDEDEEETMYIDSGLDTANENKKMTVQMIKTLLNLYNGDKMKIMKEYDIDDSIVDTITNIDVRNSNNDQMLTFRNGNKEVPQSQKRKEINKFPQDYVYNNIEEDKDEVTKILCYLTIPRIVCRNGILQLMLVSPLLRNQPLIQRENYQLSFKNVETLQTLEKINVNLLTACFQKTGTSFGIQFINKSTFTKNTYSIFTRYPDECKKLVEGLNYLLRYQ